MTDLGPSIVSAASGVLGETVGGVLSWLGVSKAESGKTQREREARASEREIEDQRLRAEFQRETINATQEELQAMSDAASQLSALRLVKHVDVIDPLEHTLREQLLRSQPGIGRTGGALYQCVAPPKVSCGND